MGAIGNQPQARLPSAPGSRPPSHATAFARDGGGCQDRVHGERRQHQPRARMRDTTNERHCVNSKQRHTAAAGPNAATRRPPRRGHASHSAGWRASGTTKRAAGLRASGTTSREGGQEVTKQALPSVNDLDLPFFDYNEPGLVGELYHQRLAEVRRKGWLARSPLALVVLDQESGEFFLRARDTAFPG